MEEEEREEEHEEEPWGEFNEKYENCKYLTFRNVEGSNTDINYEHERILCSFNLLKTLILKF